MNLIDFRDFLELFSCLLPELNLTSLQDGVLHPP